MQGIIHIIDDIGSFANVNGVSLQHVISQVKSQPDADSFLVKIKTNGGLVDTGFDIYNYLRSLNKPITTRAIGGVYSIGAVIFMAGDIRQMQEGVSELMIHNPMVVPDESNLLEAIDLEQMAKEMRQTENEIGKFLSKATNNPMEAIMPLMREETFIDPSKAVKMGFATEIFTPFNKVAFAYPSNFNIKNKKMSKEQKSSKQRKDILNALGKALGLSKVSVLVRTATGDDLDFAEVSEGTPVNIGDVATLNGEPAEGLVLLESGETYVFEEGGVLMEILPIVEEDQEIDPSFDEAAFMQKMLNAVASILEPVIAENERLNQIVDAREKTFNSLSKMVGQEINHNKASGRRAGDENTSKVSAFQERKQRRLAKQNK